MGFITHCRRVVIILEIDVVKPAEEVDGKIGEPTPYTDGKTSKHINYLCQVINYVLFKWYVDVWCEIFKWHMQK